MVIRRCAGGGSDWSQTGFTLVELMVVVVILSTLLGIGVPLFEYFIKDQRVKTTASDMLISLILTRSEAVKRNESVVLTAYEDGWSDGWFIPSPTAGAQDIYNHLQSGTVTITGPDEVQVTPMGRVPLTPTFKISVGADGEKPFRCLFVQLDGRVEMKTDEDQVCIDL